MPQYDKLVRDRIPEILETIGKRFSTRILSDSDFLLKLNDKLREELAEYLESQERDKQIEELADMLEVIYAIADAKRMSAQGLEEIRRAKADTRGGFRKRILLEWVED